MSILKIEKSVLDIDANPTILERINRHGFRLARMMIKYNVGCREEEVLTLKKVDEDFFE